MKCRPWGPLEWALSLSTRKDWRFVGAIGTEERSLCSWTQLKHLDVLRDELFIEVQDVESDKFGERIRKALELRRKEFAQSGGDLAVVEPIDLMVELFRITEFGAKAEAPAVIFDITSLPKRFFFRILRMLVMSTQVRNLMLTYTRPARYAPESEPLYEDIEPWKVLPGFDGSANGEETWIVSVGFLVESLRQYLGDNPNRTMKLLVPFPAPLSILRRTWQSVANIELGQPEGRFDKFRVDTLDMSAAFDRIRSLAGTPAKPLAFAPFGPKPTSAAMCLYATQQESSVHYPQPTVYNPDYSTGIRGSDPATAISAYWVKHEGTNLYAL